MLSTNKSRRLSSVSNTPTPSVRQFNAKLKRRRTRQNSHRCALLSTKSTVGDAGFVPLTSGGSFNDEHAVTGDPSLELAPETDESDAYTEANYVHNLVSTIDAETAIVPVGFMQVDGQNSLIEKATPSRISEVDALRVDSYRIMGTPPMWREQVASGKSADDILEVLGAAKKGESVRGCWKVVRSAGGSSVCVRNLFWPGFSAFYNVGTNSFGTMYIGTGHKNRDVPFML